MRASKDGRKHRAKHFETRHKRGKTAAEIIEERIEWMKTPVRKPDGEMRPRIESWENVARHLRNFLSPRLRKKLASEVIKHDIAMLSNEIVAGKLGGKASVSNARHMRRAASGLFAWACEAGRDYVTASPCVNLPIPVAFYGAQHEGRGWRHLSSQLEVIEVPGGMMAA